MKSYACFNTETRMAAQSFTFTSQPRAVVSQRPKFRDPLAPEPYVTLRVIVYLFTHGILRQPLSSTYSNLMSDPRVVRGNTYRLQTLPAVRLIYTIE